MHEIRLNNWKSFIEEADEFDIGITPNKAYAFRGLSNTAWNLKPSLLRQLSPNTITEQQALDIEKIALAEFRAQAHLHLLPSTLVSTESTFSWWTLMQHHGAPTRLLDWTTSLFVALYFAVIDQFDKDGAIWIVHLRSLSNRITEKYGTCEFPKTESVFHAEFLQSNAPHALLFVNRLTKFDRIISQQGMFSVSRNILGDHGNILSELLEGESDRIKFSKIIVPANLKIPFLRKLRTMNITANSLFPGIDGLARSVAELFKLGLG